MNRPFTEYQDTPLWRAVRSAVTDLQATGEVAISTAPDYVIGYLCRELEAKRIVSPDALAAGPKR